MSLKTEPKRRSRGASFQWVGKLIAGLLVIAVLLVILFLMSRAILAVLGVGQSDVAPDPMFAEEVDPQPTMPPEWTQEEDGENPDRSAEWDQSVQTPVDKTAAELMEESQQITEP